MAKCSSPSSPCSPLLDSGYRQSGMGEDVRWQLPELLRDFGVPAESLLSSRWTRVGAMRLHSRVSERAGGIPFVLIHGLVISSLYMIPLAESLAGANAVFALDLPGFGRSKVGRRVLSIEEQARAVCDWMDALGMESCHLVANSLGCQICARVAAARPAAVISLTLIGATIDPAARGRPRQLLRLLHDAWLEPARLWANWIFDFARAGLRRAMGTVDAMFADRIEQSLPSVTSPTLVMRGSLDPTMPMRWAAEMAAQMPSAHVVVVPGAAHCVHFSDPVPVAALIRRHAFESMKDEARSRLFLDGLSAALEGDAPSSPSSYPAPGYGAKEPVGSAFPWDSGLPLGAARR